MCFLCVGARVDLFGLRCLAAVSYQIQTCLLRTFVVLSRRAATSIKCFHVSGVSKELAEAVGQCETADLSLDNIVTSILDDTRGDADGSGAEAWGRDQASANTDIEQTALTMIESS